MGRGAVGRRARHSRHQKHKEGRHGRIRTHPGGGGRPETSITLEALGDTTSPTRSSSPATHTWTSITWGRFRGARGNPAVLLLGPEAAKVDGLEVLKQIRSDAKLKLIPSWCSPLRARKNAMGATARREPTW
jgi:hypothetical protein